MPATFSVGSILAIILRHLKESPRTLAELYVYRDRTLVYKWLHGSATPAKTLVAGIVKFVMEKSCEPVRLSMRHELEECVRTGGLRPEIAAQLIQTEPFQKFIEDMLNLAISLPSNKSAATESVSPVDGDSPVVAPWSGNTRGRSLPISELVRALLAVLVGGIVWNGINRALAWTYFMGGDGLEPKGIAAAIWGLTVTVPIACVSQVAYTFRSSRISAADWLGTIGIAILYALAGVVGALAFYDSGLRRALEGLYLAYGMQEFLIAIAFAMIISLPPLFVLIGAARRANAFWPEALEELGYAVLPTLLVGAAVCLTLFIDRPKMELEQLRGFLAGLMLRIGMYIGARGHGIDASTARCNDRRPAH